MKSIKKFLISLFGLKAYPGNKPERVYKIYFYEVEGKGWCWELKATNGEEICRSSEYFSKKQKCYENWFKMKTAKVIYNGLSQANWKTICKRYSFSSDWNALGWDKDISKAKEV